MRANTKLKGPASALAGAALIAAPRIAHACATCGLPAGDPENNAFFASSVALLSAPYLVFGAIAGVIYLGYRSAMKKRADEARAADASSMLAKPEPTR